MEEKQKAFPLWVRIPGYVGGIAAFGFFLFIAQNEYLFKPIVGRVGLGVVLAAGIAYKLIRKKPLNLLLLLTVFLGAYGFIMILGGLFFMGYWAFVLILLSVTGCWFALRRKSPLYRLSVAFVIICFIGAIPVKSEREFERDRCEKIAQKQDPVFKVFDDRMHAYDFETTTDPPLLAATFGLDKRIAVYDLENLSFQREIRMPSTGVQRLTRHPDGRHLFAAAWGHWADDKVLAVVDPVKGKIERYYNTAGCSNAFEVAVGQDKQKIYLVCESSHNVLQFDINGTGPERSVELPGFDAYDIIRHNNDLYVTDWLSPYMSKIKLPEMDVRLIRIGFTAFGVAIGPEGKMIYVARPIASEVVGIEMGQNMPSLRIDVGFGARDMAVDSRRNLLFVGNYFDGTLDVINLSNHERISRKYAGRLLRGLYYDAPRDRLFLATGCGLLVADVKNLL